MLLRQYNLEFPGMGVALFSVAIFATLLFWNIYHKSNSILAKTIQGYLIGGIVYGIFSWGFFLTGGLDPMFYTNIGARYDLMLVNLAEQFMILFNIIYIRRKTARNGKANDPVILVVYALNLLVAVAWIANAVLSTSDQPLLSVLTADGMVYNQSYYHYVQFANTVIMLAPFVFIAQGWSRSIPKERVILVLFAAIPWIANLLQMVVYDGAELDVTYGSYAILGILMVFFDQIQLDEAHQKQSALAEKLAFEAMHDRLTGLTATDIFQQQVGDHLSVNGSTGGCLAVIDIDGFNEINTIYGRQFGDEVLKRAAKLLKEVVRYDDMVGRIGGDEFAVYFKCDVRYFDGLVAKIRDKLEFEYDGVPISASVGAVRVSDNDSDYDYLFTLADKTLNQAKREGPSSYKLLSK